MMTIMSPLTDSFMKKIAHLLQEEELDIYTLTLYCLNEADLDFFVEKDRRRVEAIFGILLEDTKKHAELLRLIVSLRGAV